jgi:hypothetical protein
VNKWERRDLEGHAPERLCQGCNGFGWVGTWLSPWEYGKDVRCWDCGGDGLRRERETA